MENFLEEFKKAKADPTITHKLFKNAMGPMPEWQSFLDYIEFSKTAGNYRSDQPGFYVIHTDPFNHDLSPFMGIQDLKVAMKKIYGDEIDQAGITLLLSEYSKDMTKNHTGITKHSDPQDTIHWGCIGTSEWHIFQKPTDEEYLEYIVEPGDIFWARKHMIHDVYSLTPRAACILTMHKFGVTEYAKGQRFYEEPLT
jgi:hypothetical protein